MSGVLAFDLGTKTGWCFGTGGAPLISGVMDLKPGRFDSSGMRFVRFISATRRLVQTHAPDIIVFEEVRAHRGTDAAHIYGGLLAHLQVIALDEGIQYEGHTVQAIKRYATGRGNADKPAMLAAVREWGYRPADDNEADAIALCRLKLAELGQ